MSGDYRHEALVKSIATGQCILAPTMTHLIVVPCYNEADRWNPSYWMDLVSIKGVRWIFVNDGSLDATQDLLTHFVNVYCEGIKSASVLSLETNVGKGEAIRQGWNHAMSTEHLQKFSSVGFIDADGAFEKSDIERILATFKSKVTGGPFQSVWSSRVSLAGRNIERHARRHYIGRIVATFLSAGGYELPYDTQSGLKLFENTPAFQDAIQLPFRTRWLFEMEIMGNYQFIHGDSMSIWEMPLLNWRDVGSSKITRYEAIRIVKELIVIKGIQRQRRFR